MDFGIVAAGIPQIIEDEPELVLLRRGNPLPTHFELIVNFEIEIVVGSAKQKE